MGAAWRASYQLECGALVTGRHPLNTARGLEIGGRGGAGGHPGAASHVEVINAKLIDDNMLKDFPRRKCFPWCTRVGSEENRQFFDSGVHHEGSCEPASL